ncbi:MAG: hypothetical protein GY847_35025 [Proteobacteria bacterium]|nr:hypothetical protein [Pseudomonadota bacterium]
MHTLLRDDPLLVRVFDNAIMPLGGRFSPTTLDQVSPDVKRLYSEYDHYINTMLYHQSSSSGSDFLSTIFFGYVQNLAFNALASHLAQQTHFIAIFGGSILWVYDIFLELLSNPKVLPDVGDSSKEDANGDMKGFSAVERKAPKLDITPKDPYRFQCAMDLGFLALQFLFHHELSHVCRGHLNYIKDTAGRPLYMEFGEEHGAGIEPSVARALECDADAVAVNTTLVTARRLALGHRLPMFPETFLPYASPHQALKSWSFAVSILFRLIDWYSDTPGNPEERTHPSPLTRERLVNTVARVYFTSYFPEARLAEQGVVSGFASAAEAWSLLGWPESELDSEQESAQVIRSITKLQTELNPLIQSASPLGDYVEMKQEW